jgi:hypothetical protein
MQSYLIDSVRGGIADYDDKGIAGAFKFAKNANIRKDTDSLTCNQAMLDETPPAEGFNALIDVWVPSSDGNIYGFARNGRIYKRESNGTWTLVYTDTNGAILGAWEWGHSNGKKYLFWATATRLNSKEIPGLSNWSDINANIVVGSTTYTYPKVNLTSAANHMMRGIGGGIGALVICNDETLALVGYDGSYTNEILRFTPGNAAKTLLRRGMEVIVGTSAKNQLVQSALFSWDGQDTEEVFGFDNEKPLSLQDIRAMIDTELPLLVDNKGRVFYGDFISRQPLFAFPGSGGTVNAEGVTNDDDMALFGVYGNGAGKTGIYSYGRKKKNASICPNLEYQFDCDEIGAIIKVGNNLFASYKNGDNYGVKNIDQANKAIAVYESLILKKPRDYGFQKDPTWGPIVLTMAPLPTNCNVSVKYRLNRAGDWKNTNISGGALTFGEATKQEVAFFVSGRATYEEIQVTLTPYGNSTPEIYQIQSFFS